ncbi:MAG: hypothetical protein WC753_00580 [Candidatus Gracilibacteria bacterium]
MKKTLLLITLIGTSSIFGFAQDSNYDGVNQYVGMPSEICTITSEPCGLSSKGGLIGGTSGQMSRYRCCVQSKTGFVEFVADIYKYIFFISLILGVLFLVIFGVGYSISGVSTEEIKTMAKEKIIAIIIGLVALTLIPWILKTVVPFFFV